MLISGIFKSNKMTDKLPLSDGIQESNDKDAVIIRRATKEKIKSDSTHDSGNVKRIKHNSKSESDDGKNRYESVLLD